MSESWQTFDAVASSYDVVRPDYPVEVYEAIESFVGLSTPRVLEVGIGSGQATQQMVVRDWVVVGVEPGADLAALAAERLASSQRVALIEAKFEDVDLAGENFDVVAAATAWHWVDPTVGYQLAAEALKPSGVLTLWWNAHVTTPGNQDWDPIRDAYLRVAPELADLARLTPDRPGYDPAAEVSACGLFGDVQVESFHFAVRYPAEQFIALTHTYASHGSLTPSRRELLDDALRDTINEELGGTVRKPYEAYLVLARRDEASRRTTVAASPPANGT
jgi:SAM-dependent methyltransferase